MSELKARNASELKSFRSSTLKAFGGGFRELTLVFGADSFDVLVEVDKIEIWRTQGFLSEILLKTVNLANVTCVIFEKYMNLTLLKEFISGGSFNQGMRSQTMAERAGGSFTVTREDDPLGFTTGNPVSVDWYAAKIRLQTFSTSTDADQANLIWGDQVGSRTHLGPDPGTSPANFRQSWTVADQANAAFGDMRGICLHGFDTDSSAENLYAFALFWPSSENPALPVDSQGWTIKAFGRLVFRIAP